ncbi:MULTISPECIES: response regulator [Burkholderiaceae]|uniref:response regulator transcription factor n=1 Tax=Burkholderiaceae TaxID=119060 RepID=UPI00141E1353|nr:MULTISPECIES: response regulator [Burkholderiaceae]MBN3846814.1 response regulator [Paraburkholderia sp. Ac-20342]NIF51179.1 response regulator [Burkholderia sp. Ax-1724]NIF76004.1 response regulator [Paraburkholderia sp. Cy-641]
MGTQTNPTIAIVDDDRDVRKALRSFLRARGRSVHEFASAIELLQSNRLGEIACLITDVRMPGLSGTELHERLIALGYVIPTIFITAFPTCSVEAMLNSAGVVAVYSKPVDPGALSNLLATILDVP